MEESKQQRCHREARKYPRMHRKKLGATRKTFRSTRIRDRRESMKKRRDHKRSRKNSMNTMSLYLGVDQIRAHRGNLKPVAICHRVANCHWPKRIENPVRQIGTQARPHSAQNRIARRARSKETVPALSYGISTSLPVDCRDSMNLCASAACANGNALPTSSLSLPSAISLNDSSIPRRIKSGTPATVYSVKALTLADFSNSLNMLSGSGGPLARP